MAGFSAALDYTILLLAKKPWNLFAFLLSAGETTESTMSLGAQKMLGIVVLL